MGAHMLPGRERWRARRRSIRFIMGATLAIPVLAVLGIWGFAGVTLTEGLEHNRTAQHGTVLIRVALADVIGLVAVLVATVVMFWFARRVSRDVSSLEATARRFADQRFPDLMARLRRGEPVSAEADASAVADVKITEVARAAEALAGVQRTAVAAAATETSLRSGVSQVFVSLARRNQSLLQRQLRLLDDLERRAADPAALADLFPLDHLTTRMRRHAEGLIILSGAVPGRGWSRPVPVIDVIRGAIAEVEDYKRIAVVTTAEEMVIGSAVADMIHLLAELIENAAMFSPSGTRVEVRAERVGNGFAFEIEDRGLGIKAEELDAINERLGSPADFDLANADQLGLFVVGKLAARHGVRVFLRPSPYGGTTAIVVLPRTMVTQEAETSTDDQPAEEIRGAGRNEELQLALTGRRMRRTAPAADDLHARLGVEPGVSDAVAAPAALPAAAGQPGFPARADAAAHPEPSATADTEITAAQPVFPAPPAVSSAEPAFPAPPAPASASPSGFPPPPDSSHTQPSFFRLGTGPVLPPSPTPANQPAPGEPAHGQPAATESGPRSPAAGSGSAALPTRHGARNARPSLFQARSDPPDLTGRMASPQAPGPVTQRSSAAQQPGLTHPVGPGQPASPAQPAGGPAPPGPSGTAGTHLGLPRRVRQANLSPHLRGSGSVAGPPTRGPEARSPEQAKSLLSSLQRGWERGRETEVPDSEATGGGQNAGGGARQASQEET
ncbi:MAG TPA: ATP-binding protein [Streptosporangiaceae bacterium]|nr:ATP-binding protein [Streptosporangiaceae bacterium]